MIEPEILEVSNPDTPAHLSRNTVSVPSAWILLLLVPLFVGAIYIQGIEFVNRQSSREVKIENDASIREFSKARNAFDEQAAGWQKLSAARKTEISQLEVAIIELEAKVKVHSASEGEQRAKSEEVKQTLESLNADLVKRRSELSELQAEIQTTKARSRAIESAVADLQKTYVSKKAEKEEMQAELTRLIDEVAVNSVKLKQQLDSIRVNEATSGELAKVKIEMAGIAQEKMTAEKILTNLTPDVQRLSAKRSELVDAIAVLQQQSIQFSEDAIAELKKSYTTIKTETEQLKSDSTKLVNEIAVNSNKLRQQQEFIETNASVAAELTSAKEELAGIAQQKQTAAKILEAITPEVQRLSAKRSDLLAETDLLQKSVDRTNEDLKQLGQKRDALLKEIESLKSDPKPEKDQ